MYFFIAAIQLSTRKNAFSEDGSNIYTRNTGNNHLSDYTASHIRKVYL